MAASTRKFGIEIETTVPTVAPVNPEGHGTGRGNGIEQAPDGWKAQYDSSISAGNGRKGVEIVSPVLQGEEGIAEVFYMAEWLQEIGAKGNDSTGLHIHVDAAGLTSSDVQAILNAFVDWQPVLYGACGQKAAARWSGFYSKHLSSKDLDRMSADRYQGLNLTNWKAGRRGKNTIEFRLFSSTTDAEVITTFAYMVTAFVDAIVAREHRAPTAHTAAEFSRVFWTNPEHRLIPDEPIDDVEAVLARQLAQATIV